MKTLILFLLVVILIAGCRGSKIVTETVTETKWRDTVVYVEKPIYIDTTLAVAMPHFKDSVRIRDSVRVSGNLAYSKSIHKEVGIIAVDATVYKSVLTVDAYLTDSSILYNYRDTLQYQDSITIYNAIRDKVTVSTLIKPPEKYVPAFYKYLLMINIFIVVAGVLYVVSRMGVFGNYTNLIKRK
jgi:hypothetical protein